MAEQILSIKSLSYAYQNGRDFRLDDLSFSIERNSITSVLGRNGTGKTTLLMLILGYLNPAQGEIRFSPQNTHEKVGENENRIAYLPQIENVPANLTVGNFLLMGRLPFISPFSVPLQKDIDRVAEHEKMLGIEYMHDYEVGKISGGELQRVRIGRALAQESELVLLDEPITHLDLNAKYAVMDLIKELQALGKTIIFTTHDPVESLQIADYAIMIMGNSRIMHGNTHEIITSQNLSACFELPVKVIRDNSGFACVVEK